MAEETQTASSPVEVEDVFQGKEVSMAEFSRYRADGELPERFKPADTVESDPTDTPDETAKPEGESLEPSPDSETDATQEQKPSTPAQKRILQLLAEKKELERKLAEKQDVKPESSPAPVEQFTRPKPTAEDKKEDGTPKFNTYEDYIEDLSDWKDEQREVKRQREQLQKDGTDRLNAKVEEGRTRYENLDEVVVPAANEIYNDKAISPVVKQMIADSDVIVDLMYTIASDPAEYAKFVKMAKETPGKAIRFIALTESFIAEELAGKVEETPAKPRTQAPKPAATVGGTTSRSFDVSDESLSADEWARKRTQQLNQRR